MGIQPQRGTAGDSGCASWLLGLVDTRAFRYEQSAEFLVAWQLPGDIAHIWNRLSAHLARVRSAEVVAAD